jgi:hypothetical protein
MPADMVLIEIKGMSRCKTLSQLQGFSKHSQPRIDG